MPIQLGPLGTLIMAAMVLASGAITLALAIIAYRQRAWRSTADAAVAEMAVHKESAERLREDNSKLHAQIAELSKQRDLEPIIAAMGVYFNEGRDRFMRAEAALQANTNVLAELIAEVKAQRSTSEDAYRQLTASFIAHTLEDKEAQLEATRTRLRVAEALSELERRLSQVAVQIGVAKWETAAGPQVKAK